MRPRKSSTPLTTPNPEHLFEQADRLATPPPAGAPRQVDLRRAISAAYYGLLHAVLTAAADEFVGSTQLATARYRLTYRSIDHAALRSLCKEAQKSNLAAKYAQYSPARGFGGDIQAFAAAALDLQEKRLSADYDPLFRVRTSDAVLAIKTARSALERLRKANKTRRKAFLMLLLFAPR
jgi:hypothetical protein